MPRRGPCAAASRAALPCFCRHRQQRFASPIFLELLSTLDQHLRDKGLHLAVFAARTRDEEASIVRQIVDERLADGLILGRTRKKG